LGDEGHIPKLNRNFDSFNAAVGYKNNLTDRIIARINIASGFRAPNLAELTSNGVHEGTNRYEIGNLNLKNEQNVQTDLAIEFSNDHFEFFANGFYNTINNYVFIAPDGTFVNEDSVYRYRQQNADLYGGEIGFHLHPHPYDWLHFESGYQTVIGKLNHGEPLPLIPANSLTNTLRVEFTDINYWLHSSYIFTTLNSVFKQKRVSSFETDSPGYSLLHFGMGGKLSVFDQDVNIRIAANNLLDKSYISHLSRLKVDGIPNPGRNISMAVGLSF
ncbi:MAG TPA: TonB-dependent receptor, partial [Arenibacter sp.]|nr:TonB-dependent receptor [Arenibacter sp.]